MIKLISVSKDHHPFSIQTESIFKIELCFINEPSPQNRHFVLLRSGFDSLDLKSNFPFILAVLC